MHFPLVSPASALLIAAFIPIAVAVPARSKRDIQYCTSDDILGPLSNYLPFQADVTQFCSTLIDIQNVASTVATTTPVSTVYSTTVIIGSTTRTVTSYTTTATVTTTSAVFELKRRNEVEIAARAAVTDVLKPVYKEIQARQAAAGTSTNFDASAISAALVSACSCLYITPGTNYITATASTRTLDEGVIRREAVTDTVTTVASGATTTTVLVNSTSKILPLSSSSVSSSISMSSISSYSPTSSLSSSYPSMSFSSFSTSSSFTSTPMLSSISSMSVSTNSTSISSSAPSSNTVGPVPTGCPYINGTIFSSSNPCQSYQYICGVNYPDGDFYNLEESYDSVEMCAADVCTHANSGKTTPCLGVVWNAADGNCRELKSLADPFYDQSSIGALSIRSDSLSCRKNISSSSSSMSSTASGPYSMNISTTSNMPVSMNTSTTWSMNTSTTWSYPTGTGSWPHHDQNKTHTSNGTWPTHNHTWSRWMTSGYSSGTGVTSGSPIATKNNTCPITTAISTVTKLATLYSGNYTFTTTETQYINALPNNVSTITQVSLVTVVTTDLFTTTTDSTTTVVNNHLTVTDTTFTSVETDMAFSTTTETSLIAETLTVTETDVKTTTTDSTEVDSQTTTTTTTTTASTETDVLTITTTISTETATTTSYASTESDVATLTTTDSSTTTTTTTVSTETDTATATTTVDGNQVGGRFGRSWWMF